MTLFTGYAGMASSQLKGRGVVIKRGGLPGLRGMAGAAILSELPVVVIIFLVTVKTGGRSSLEYIINMAVSAFRLRVFTFQCKFQ